MQIDTIPLHRHAKPHKELARRYKTYYADRDYRLAAWGAFALFLASLGASLAAGHFANINASNPSSDIILSNTPALNVDFLFVWGTALFVIFMGGIALAHPRRIPYTFCALALFFFTRAAFVSMTHIAPFPDRATMDIGVTARHYFFGSDLFFSGHTGTPFMMALVFWRTKILRYAFLGWSIFFGFIVLAGHLHYTIDVASAFFITYTIHKIVEWFFPDYRDLFHSDEEPETSGAPSRV